MTWTPPFATRCCMICLFLHFSRSFLNFFHISLKAKWKNNARRTTQIRPAVIPTAIYLWSNIDQEILLVLFSPCKDFVLWKHSHERGKWKILSSAEVSTKTRFKQKVWQLLERVSVKTRSVLTRNYVNYDKIALKSMFSLQVFFHHIHWFY